MFHRQFGELPDPGRADDHCRKLGQACNDHLSSSWSGSATKMSTALIVITNRNALGTPFHCCDCHMPNHSPPIDMKPTCHSRNPSMRPTTGNVFARLNALASARM